MKHLLFVTICLSLASGQVKATNWDVFYSGSVLPENATPVWSRVDPDAGVITAGGGALRIQDNSTTDYVYYVREPGSIYFTPITMEARVRVASASSMYSAIMWLQTQGQGSMKGTTANLHLFPDHIQAYYPGFVDLRFDVDLTTYRTLRLAVNENNTVHLFVDGQPALTWQNTIGGGQNGIRFGSNSIAGKSDVYWQYVAYSKAFLPVPEPGTLVTLACGLAGMAGILRRKTKQ